MGVRFATALNTLPIQVLPPSNAETIVWTTSPLGLTQDAALVLILGDVAMTIGTGTTALIFQIRRGPLITSPLIGGTTVTQTVVAGNSQFIPYFTGDVNSGVAVPQYSLTIQQTGATAAGVISAGTLFAFVL